MGLLAVSDERVPVRYRAEVSGKGPYGLRVFFDVCQIRFEYEPEGFWPDDGERYLRDFWLPRLGCYFEVKSDLPTLKEIYKCHSLADEPRREWRWPTAAQVLRHLCTISLPAGGGTP